jgi:hypothetical protein
MTSAPASFVNALTRSTSDSVVESIVSVAPDATAASSFSREPAAAITRAPSAAPSCTAASPTPPPAPVTKSVSPLRSAPRSTRPWYVVPYVSGNAAASSNDMPSGILKTDASAVLTSSANPPTLQRAITRSPGSTLVTRSPTSSTVPATSAPGLNGNGGFD